MLSEVAPEQRREVASPVWDANEAAAAPVEGLYIALRGKEVCAGAWGQRQPGNTAVLWPPKWNGREVAGASARLVAAVVGTLDTAGIAMTQVLLPSRETEIASLLQEAQFRYLATLLYLTCEASDFPTELPTSGDLQFEAYHTSQGERLKGLIEQTYKGTRDCTGLDGTRDVSDVLAGYLATGTSGTANWYFIRASDRDVGVLLLAEHAGSQHWELVYMGLTPEARGRSWGVRITREAQWLARHARVERIVLAVDSANLPAIAMYREAGFVAWDKRAVFVRFKPCVID